TNTTSGYTLEPTETTQYFRIQNKFDELLALAKASGIPLPYPAERDTMETTVNNPLLATAYCLEHGLKPIKEARQLHEQLVEAHTLSALDKRRIGRQIVALLSAIE